MNVNTEQTGEQSRIERFGDRLHALTDEDRKQGGLTTSPKKRFYAFINGIKGSRCKQCIDSKKQGLEYCDKHQIMIAVTELIESTCLEDVNNVILLCICKTCQRSDYTTAAKLLLSLKSSMTENELNRKENVKNNNYQRIMDDIAASVKEEMELQNKIIQQRKANMN